MTAFRYQRPFLTVLLVVSIVGNFALFFLWQKATENANLASNLHKQYPLMSRRGLDPKYPNDLLINFLPLRNQIHKEVDPNANSFAVFFEYLPTGTTIGINEDNLFTAESLLKVPVVMAYYHKRERLNLNDDPVIQIQQNELNNKFGDLYKKGAGYSIHLSDAVRLALQKSDNTASLILADQISDDDFKFVYEGLDIPLELEGNNPIITVQEYTSILKALYFGSVLSNDNSEKILNLLTHTDFRELMPSGLPEDIPIAHKIGLVENQIYQDCGIVYLPSRPYSLCMVSKSDNKTARARMQKISQMVYKYVSEQQK